MPQANITTLGPLVLPLSEQALFIANLIARKLLKLKVGSVCVCVGGGVGVSHGGLLLQVFTH